MCVCVCVCVCVCGGGVSVVSTLCWSAPPCGDPRAMATYKLANAGSNHKVGFCMPTVAGMLLC